MVYHKLSNLKLKPAIYVGGLIIAMLLCLKNCAHFGEHHKNHFMPTRKELSVLGYFGLNIPESIHWKTPFGGGFSKQESPVALEKISPEINKSLPEEIPHSLAFLPVDRLKKILLPNEGGSGGGFGGGPSFFGALGLLPIENNHEHIDSDGGVNDGVSPVALLGHPLSLLGGPASAIPGHVGTGLVLGHAVLGHVGTGPVPGRAIPGLAAHALGFAPMPVGVGHAALGHIGSGPVLGHAIPGHAVRTAAPGVASLITLGPAVTHSTPGMVAPIAFRHGGTGGVRPTTSGSGYTTPHAATLAPYTSTPIKQVGKVLNIKGTGPQFAGTGITRPAKKGNGSLSNIGSAPYLTSKPSLNISLAPTTNPTNSPNKQSGRIINVNAKGIGPQLATNGVTSPSTNRQGALSDALQRTPLANKVALARFLTSKVVKDLLEAFPDLLSNRNDQVSLAQILVPPAKQIKASMGGKDLPGSHRKDDPPSPGSAAVLAKDPKGNNNKEFGKIVKIVDKSLPPPSPQHASNTSTAQKPVSTLADDVNANPLSAIGDPFGFNFDNQVGKNINIRASKSPNNKQPGRILNLNKKGSGPSKNAATAKKKAVTSVSKNGTASNDASPNLNTQGQPILKLTTITTANQGSANSSLFSPAKGPKLDLSLTPNNASSTKSTFMPMANQLLFSDKEGNPLTAIDNPFGIDYEKQIGKKINIKGTRQAPLVATNNATHSIPGSVTLNDDSSPKLLDSSPIPPLSLALQIQTQTTISTAPGSMTVINNTPISTPIEENLKTSGNGANQADKIAANLPQPDKSFGKKIDISETINNSGNSEITQISPALDTPSSAETSTIAQNGKNGDLLSAKLPKLDGTPNGEIINFSETDNSQNTQITQISTTPGSMTFMNNEPVSTPIRENSVSSDNGTNQAVSIAAKLPLNDKEIGKDLHINATGSMPSKALPVKADLNITSQVTAYSGVASSPEDNESLLASPDVKNFLGVLKDVVDIVNQYSSETALASNQSAPQFAKANVIGTIKGSVSLLKNFNTLGGALGKLFELSLQEVQKGTELSVNDALKAAAEAAQKAITKLLKTAGKAKLPELQEIATKFNRMVKTIEELGFSTIKLSANDQGLVQGYVKHVVKFFEHFKDDEEVLANHPVHHKTNTHIPVTNIVFAPVVPKEDVAEKEDNSSKVLVVANLVSSSPSEKVFDGSAPLQKSASDQGLITQKPLVAPLNNVNLYKEITNANKGELANEDKFKEVMGASIRQPIQRSSSQIASKTSSTLQKEELSSSSTGRNKAKYATISGHSKFSREKLSGILLNVALNLSQNNKGQPVCSNEESELIRPLHGSRSFDGDWREVSGQ